MLTIEQITNALEKKAGNITEAAKALKVTRQALHLRISADEGLQKVVADAREAVVDVAESEALKQIKQGNTAIIIFTLKTLGKSRGYVERTEITGANGGAIRFTADDAAKAKKELNEWQEKKLSGSSAAKT